ncbi:phosphomannomutase [Methylophaga lonarensis MPL]|uniref:phosphomannomutase n=1 Tax=Methylophaga lonarensis MPL TaxID=1286106 RepID=M7NZQ9_9GAMM|nr:phosphomannomutase/phosphoglucomutase [Methylophaga lonarensis]EMR14313.1 phosphomannomutase [Methylophaga lonarensis MPL]
MKPGAERWRRLIPDDLRMIGRPVLGGLLLLIWLFAVGILFFLSHQNQTTDYQDYRKKHQETAERLAASVSSVIGQWERQLEAIAANVTPQMRAESEASESGVLLQDLTAQWPDASALCLVSRIPSQATTEGCIPLSYAALATLYQVEAEGRADYAVMLPGTDNAYLLMAEALPEPPLAIVLAALPVQQLSLMMQQILNEPGFVELQQGSQQRVSVASSGNAQFQSMPAFEQSIPFSHWQVVFYPDEAKPALQISLVQLALALAIASIVWWLIAQLLIQLFPKSRWLSVSARSGKWQTQSVRRPLMVESGYDYARGVAKQNTPQTADQAVPEVSSSIFKAYDIRGIVGDTLNKKVARQIGRAIGSQLVSQNIHEIIVGRDGRNSSESLSKALSEGLMSAGASVIDIGMVPTPVLYFACHTLSSRSGVMVTGSHNPRDYNGFKIMVDAEMLSSDQIKQLYRRIERSDFTLGTASQEQADVVKDYLAKVSSDIFLSRPLKLVVDCGNGVAGMIAPQLFRDLGCEVVELFCEVDGEFPNHHPDPAQPQNMQALAAKVRETNADLGLAFDGDGDRLGVVDGLGEIIWPDRLLMLFAEQMLSRTPGASVIYDVKSTHLLEDIIKSSGGQAVLAPSGYTIIKKRMQETGAILGGEMSGHIFFADRWFGFDDALYSACRLLELLTADDQRRSPAEIFSGQPARFNTPEIHVAMDDIAAADFIERFQERAEFTDAEITTIDGYRVDYSDSWGLVRKSNTVPGLTLRFEASSEEGLEEIKLRFLRQMLQIRPDIHLG